MNDILDEPFPDHPILDDPILDGPIRNMQRAIQAREITSVELVKGFFQRIQRINPTLNALVLSNEEFALKQAAKADVDLSAGKIHGPLHGIPMTIKDSLDTQEMITTWGTLGRKSLRPGRDATVVERLRSAGAILMGKSNTPEFTLSFHTDNLVYGRTNNPFDSNRTPGGSSGGAAALIASGLTPFDIGTDTGGSIRLPAHFCGIAGIKPTTGRVPCTGNALPQSGLLAPLSQPGPLAKYVDDLDLLLGLICGPDLNDPYSVDAKWNTYTDVNVTELRIGYHSNNGIKAPSAEIQDNILDMIGILGNAGFKCTEARPPGIEMASFIYGSLFNADAGETVETLLQDSQTTQASPPILDSLAHRQTNQQVSSTEMGRVLTLWDNYKSSMLGYFHDYDILICPVNAKTAIQHDETEEMTAYSYTFAFNLTGWPGVVVRTGTDNNGLPIGIQILAQPFREDRCLAIAAWLENQLRVTRGKFSKPTF